MPISHRIVAVRKPNRSSELEHITHVQYDGVIHPREDVIRGIKSGADSFYVKTLAATAEVEVVEPYGKLPYIRTKPDWTGRDNLLSLPEC